MRILLIIISFTFIREAAFTQSQFTITRISNITITRSELVHEFNIANAMMHKKHQPEIQKMVKNKILFGDSIDRKKMAKMDKSMSHQHSNSVLLEPKEEKKLIWNFSKAQNIEIACNVPGHYDVDVIAQVKITQ